MVKINAIYFSIFYTLIASCSQVEGNANIVNLDLEKTTNSELVDCFHKEQPNSMELDDPYFSQCLSMSAELKTLNKHKNEITQFLHTKGWSLSETIEKTEIYRKLRSYDKCVFTIHVSEEHPPYAKDYFAKSDSRPLYDAENSTLIITIFTQPICS